MENLVKILCQITVHKLCQLGKCFENLKNTIKYIDSYEKKFGRNPKSDRDWKERKKIEMSRNKSPNRKGK